MGNFSVQVFVMSAFTVCLLSTKAHAASNLYLPVQKGIPTPPKLTKQTKRHVTINKQKFELMSQQDDHWLLYDPQLGQYCITLNQLVVVTSDLETTLRIAGWSYSSKEWDLLAEHTYRWSGPFTKLLQLHQKLKRVPDTHLEWQLQYLPHSRKAEM